MDRGPVPGVDQPLGERSGVVVAADRENRAGGVGHLVTGPREGAQRMQAADLRTACAQRGEHLDADGSGDVQSDRCLPPHGEPLGDLGEGRVGNGDQQ